MKILSAYHCNEFAVQSTANSLLGQTAPATAQPGKGYKNLLGLHLLKPNSR